MLASSPPLCSSFSSFCRITAGSGDQIDVWVCPQCLRREGEVVIVFMLAGGTVVLVDLGFVSRWIWVRSATVVCRNEARRCLFTSDLRLLCFPLSPPSAASFRASPSCSNGPRRNDESEELVGDLSFISSSNSHGFLWWCGEKSLLYQPTLDRNLCFYVNSCDSGLNFCLPVEIARSSSSGAPGRSQAPSSMPAWSHFGEFSTELPGYSLVSSELFRCSKKCFV
ncbi:hypothetical protein HID58_015892 [Brassica napus]|uniref:Uncharacterized protein n=1 Tax=Brassica napus TaxID=3708 RepID=A0ABQ8DLB7_BRANA|nr:hypothetical protein HID58_015892 [Brassica napus]